MVGVTPLPETEFSLVPASGSPKELKPLTDYVGYDETQQSESSVNADIVFVGYRGSPRVQMGRLQGC